MSRVDLNIKSRILVLIMNDFGDPVNFIVVKNMIVSFTGRSYSFRLRMANE